MSFWTINLRALGQRTDPLAKQLFSVLQGLPEVEDSAFPRSRSGALVPWVDQDGKKVPVSSLYAPDKEAERWAEAWGPWGFLWVWGLAPFRAWEQLLAQGRTVLAAEPRVEVWQRTWSSADWTPVISSPRWSPFFYQTSQVDQALNAAYSVILDGPFQTADWRVLDGPEFTGGRASLAEALDRQSADFSTQARLGRRWYRNTLLNLEAIQPARFGPVNPPLMAVAGAGPGLETALEDPANRQLLEKRPGNGFLLAATDTALGTFEARNIKPDLILTLDGQLASYHHFVPRRWPDVPILADMAALPLVGRLPNPVIFTLSGHPFHQLIARDFPELPVLDTSLGNVAGWGLRVCEALGSRHTLVWGVDCSYPQGKAYARDTYLTPFFLRCSHRLAPLETHLAAFAWRTPEVLRDRTSAGLRYTNTLLVSYKERLEAQASGFQTPLEAFPGPGLPLSLTWSGTQKEGKPLGQPPLADRTRNFLEQWTSRLAGLPEPDQEIGPRDFLLSLSRSDAAVWTTLFPLAAVILRRSLGTGRLSAPGLNQVLRDTKTEALALVQRG